MIRSHQFTRDSSKRRRNFLKRFWLQCSFCYSRNHMFFTFSWFICSCFICDKSFDLKCEPHRVPIQKQDDAYRRDSRPSFFMWVTWEYYTSSVKFTIWTKPYVMALKPVSYYGTLQSELIGSNLLFNKNNFVLYILYTNLKVT